jgi:hypothetical protein
MWWRHDRARKPVDRQARIAELERELGLEQAPEPQVTRVAKQIEALLARRDDILATGDPETNDDQRQAVLDVDRRIWRTIQVLQEAQLQLQQELQASVPSRRDRAVSVHVTTEGTNRWLVQIRMVEGEDDAEKVKEFRLAGRRHRKMVKSLIQMGERHSPPG